MHKHLIAISCTLFFGFIQIGCSNITRTPQEKTLLSAAGQKAFSEYEKQHENRAFAASMDGAYGHATKQASLDQAQRLALRHCQKHAKSLCKIIDANKIAYEERYHDFVDSSRSAISKLRIKGDRHIPLESLDWQISTPTQLRPISEGIHFPTPLTLKGIATIRTEQLVEKIQEGKIILIDSLNIGATPNATLPNSYLLDYAGVAYGDATLDRKANEALAEVMQKIAPDKTQVIATFCASVECWLSVNTAMRLQALGYTNVVWYRGGVQAWSTANLPTVNAVPFGTIQLP